VGRLDGKGPDRTDSTLTQNRGKDFRLKPVARHFFREREARKLAGLSKLSDREWARSYRASPTTTGAWRRTADELAEKANQEDGGVQAGHPVISPIAGPPPADSGATPSPTDVTAHCESGTENVPDINMSEAVANLVAAATALIESAQVKSPSSDEWVEIKSALAPLQDLVERSSGREAA
jgi:hypothetical protein